MDRKKHACLIYEFLSEQGGLEREIITHANFLKESGYEVTILTCYLDKNILKLLPFDNLKIETLGKFNTGIESLDMALCFLGLNNIKKYNPDFFLSYSYPSNFLIRNKKTKKVNYINHFPHFLYEENKTEWASSTQGVKRKISLVFNLFLGNFLKKLDRKLVHKNDLNFTNSEFTKKRMDSLYKINSIVSYPPLDKAFKPSKNNIKERFIFSSSRIIPDKKYELLIDSMKYMKNKLPLYLAGTVNENYKEKLIALANKNKVDIKFLGRLNTQEIIDYYTAAEVFAFPTPGEDFGLVPAESMACGTPCVVWGDGAGPTEQVVDKVTGYHADPYKIEDFASKLDLVIDGKMKHKNKNKILKQANKFFYGEIKKDFLKELKSNKIIS